MTGTMARRLPSVSSRAPPRGRVQRVGVLRTSLYGIVIRHRAHYRCASCKMQSRCVLELYDARNVFSRNQPSLLAIAAASLGEVVRTTRKENTALLGYLSGAFDTLKISISFIPDALVFVTAI